MKNVFITPLILVLQEITTYNVRRPIKKRPTVSPDIVHGSVEVERLINYIMLRGQKETARKIVYSALEEIKNAKENGGDPLEIFTTALRNAGPAMEVRSRRVGGANYQIPFPVQGHRQLHHAFTWLVQAARARSGMPYAQRLAAEITDAYSETGAAFKKKEDTHKMAEANRAFAHFAR
jgi:small subunit ribosomal protein S7